MARGRGSTPRLRGSLRTILGRGLDRLQHGIVEEIPILFERGLRGLDKYSLLLIGVLLVWLSWPLVVARPAIWQQAILGFMLVGLGVLLVRIEERRGSDSISLVSERVHLLLIALSAVTTLRYWYYRTTYTLNDQGWVNTFFSLLLYVAEFYAVGTLFLAYFQTLRIRDRRSVDISQTPVEQLPLVDIYIPTYNEDVEIVRKTVIGALAIDYPHKQVYLLDDGRAEKYRDRRERLRQMCAELNCILLTRDNNDHAKAGNINTALGRTQGELVLILDCDHIPARNILKETVGFFHNPTVALVQTPHWFYNPDPFERNLLTKGLVPVGNELFYKVLQKGNDTWNASFFCGSAAIIRRNYLLKVGGIATETVTEDCHTALRLHSLGYETVYYDKIMVAGLAPEKFSAYVGQQVRWARGMAQILRLENPLFNPKLKLTLPQRICYFSATSHFFFGFPRLMYLIAPILYLLLGINSVKGLGLETLFYALPHVVLSMQTNYVPYKHVRFSFWNEIYEFAMSFQAGLVTLLALVNPGLGSFNVTDKGLTVTERSFDLESVRYLVVLGALAAASLLTVPLWLIFSPEDSQAVLINAFWCLFNLVLVVASCLVAFEQPQLRRAHRLPRQLQVILHSGGQSWMGVTLNVSETGAQIALDHWPNIPDELQVELIGDYDARVLLDGQVVRAVATQQLGALLAINFINLNQVQQDDLTVILYSDVSEWYSQSRQERDNPWTSLRFIGLSLLRVFQEFRPELGIQVRKQVNFITQVYWEEWGNETKLGYIQQLSAQELRLELNELSDRQLQRLELTKPVVGLLVFPPNALNPSSLIAQVERIETVTELERSPAAMDAAVIWDNPSLDPWSTPTAIATQVYYRVVLELSFPPQLQLTQKKKIKGLLYS